VQYVPQRIRAALAVLLLAGALAAPAPRVDAICSTNPTVVGDAVTAVDEPVLIDVLANDSDAEGEALTVSLGLDNCPGDPTVDGYQLVTFTPDPVVNATCYIHYTVTDESGNSANGTITVTGDPSLIFRDGLESGDASRWSECYPTCP